MERPDVLRLTAGGLVGLTVFTLEEGGYEHCQGDKVTLGITYIADWFADRLEARRRT